MRYKLITLTAALALAASAAHATPASADDGVWTIAHVNASLVWELLTRAENGDGGAVLEASKLAEESGGDPTLSALVDAVTSAYQHSGGPAVDLQTLIDRAAAGDPSAVLELAQRQELAGVGATPDSDAVAKAWSDRGEAAWEAKILEKIRAGDVKLLFGVIRSADLATGDPEKSPFVQKASQAYDDFQQYGPPAPEKKEQKEPVGASDPAGQHDRGGGSADPGEQPESRAESWKVTDYDADGNVTGEGTKSVTTGPDGTTTTVKEMTYADGSTSKTTTVESSDGSVTTTEETTGADGNETTVTTTCDKSTNPDCGTELTNPDQDSGAAPVTADDLHALDGPTLHDMRAHPTNDPETGGGVVPSDLDFDGKPDVEPGHLDGVVDPAPDAAELTAAAAPDAHAFNVAGPEYLPDFQIGLGPVAPQGNGPVETNAQGSLRP